MQTLETKITDFSGGIKNDPRHPAGNTARVVSNFDVITNPKKMTPYRSSESGDGTTAGGTYNVQAQNYLVAVRTGTTSNLYSLRATSTSVGRALITYKALGTGGSSDLGDAGWTDAGSNNSSATGTATDFNLFVHYKRTNLIYGARDGTHIWSCHPNFTTAFNDTEKALVYTNMAQGLVHPKDDILYIPYDNKIIKNDAGTWGQEPALTLGENWQITKITPRGEYMAIAAKPVSGVGNSTVFLWDRQTSLVGVNNIIDWGPGDLNVLGEIDGILVGVSAIASTAGITHSGSDRVYFKYYDPSTGGAVKFEELVGTIVVSGTLINYFPIAQQIVNNRLYFMLSISLNGSVREGVWSVGKDSAGHLAVIHERTPNNDTALSATIFKNFFIVGDYLFQSFSTGGATNLTVTKTDNSANFSHTSAFETKKYNNGDTSKKKRLVGVSVDTEYLPTNGQVILKYRIDDDVRNASSSYNNFSQIFKNTTDNTLSYSARLIEDYAEAVTFTIATSTVTMTDASAHGLKAGQIVRFATTSALPNGGVTSLVAGTNYYVCSVSLTATAFKLAASLSTLGTPIDISGGTQSGTHTLDRSSVLPEYKEIEFRLESSGGAEITGFTFKEAVMGKRIY